MSDIKLNFSSQWPSLQVVKVFDHTSTAPFNHGLPFPPLAIAYSPTGDMGAATVDDTEVYSSGIPSGGCIAVFNLDISSSIEYPVYDEMEGEVLAGTGPDIDLRKFLLHSRAVSPMVLSVYVDSFVSASQEIEYTHSLPYPTFMFGYIRATDAGEASMPGWKSGQWIALGLAQQSWPGMSYDGYSATIATAPPSEPFFADKASIVSLRNPAIVTRNEVSVDYNG